MATPSPKQEKKWTGDQLMKLQQVIADATNGDGNTVQKILASPCLSLLCRNIRSVNEALLIEALGQPVYEVMESRPHSGFEVIHVLVNVRFKDLGELLGSRGRHIASPEELKTYWRDCDIATKCRWVFLTCTTGDVVYWQQNGYISPVMQCRGERFDPKWRFGNILVVREA